MKKRIAILGSTGSIGTQALDVIGQYPDRFEVDLLTANNNISLLARQADKYRPAAVVIANNARLVDLKRKLDGLPVKVYGGHTALAETVKSDTIDIVLSAMVGYSGLVPAVSAIEAGKAIALANKEALVIAGDLITRLAKSKNALLIPVDSEHSAIFQCLVGEKNAIEKIFLTASGGPFLGKNLEFLKQVSVKDALKHPNWDMGTKITIDSATLMNKGLEAIEAKWFFGLKPSQIEIVVHPQSIVHSLVQFEDGSIKAQLGLPDMKLPILYAFSYPERLKTDFPRFSFTDYPSLTFEAPDTERFRNLQLAFEAMYAGGTVPCAMNAANEVAVEAFLDNRAGFLDIPEIVEKTMNTIPRVECPCLDDYRQCDMESRVIAGEMVNTLKGRYY